MEDVLWKFIVPLYPVHYNRVTRVILKHLSSQINKYIPDLNGLLLEYDKKSLHISSSMDTSTFDRKVCRPHAQTVVALRPELHSVNVHAEIQARMFNPRSGLELTGTVFTIQPHLVFCKTEVNNVMAAVSRCSDTGMCQFESPVTQSAEDKQTVLGIGDVVRIRLSSATRQLGSLVLRGELISVVSKASAIPHSILDKFIPGSSDDHEGVKSDVLMKTKSEKKTRENLIRKVTVKVDGDGVVLCMPKESSSTVRSVHKRRRSASTTLLDVEAPLAHHVKIDPSDTLSAQKKFKSAHSALSEGMVDVFSSQTVQTDSTNKASTGRRTKSRKFLKQEDES